jgi:hypothetical protein
LCWPSTFLAPITTFKELGSKFRAMVLLLLHYGATTSARNFVICFYSWKDCRLIHLWKHLIKNSKLISFKPFCVCKGGERKHILVLVVLWILYQPLSCCQTHGNSWPCAAQT